MSRHVLVAGVAVLALSFTASMASAQCSFEHPDVRTPRSRATQYNSLTSSFVQAFVSCNNPGGNTPNGSTEGGVPSCVPPETFHQQAGSPAGGWMWDEGRSKGYVQFFPVRNRVENILNPPANTADLSVRFKLRSIIDQIGNANGVGTLATLARATLNDRANGPMTIVDFPAGFPFALDNGNVSLRTSANVLLNSIGQPGLPGCTSIEIVSVLVVDENGTTFANMGAFLPPVQ